MVNDRVNDVVNVRVDTIAALGLALVRLEDYKAYGRIA